MTGRALHQRRRRDHGIRIREHFDSLRRFPLHENSLISEWVLEELDTVSSFARSVEGRVAPQWIVTVLVDRPMPGGH
jgi:hypothetical protein